VVGRNSGGGSQLQTLNIRGEKEHRTRKAKDLVTERENRNLVQNNETPPKTVLGFHPERGIGWGETWRNKRRQFTIPPKGDDKKLLQPETEGGGKKNTRIPGKPLQTLGR